MRPHVLAEFVGQSHLLSPGKLLSRLLQGKSETTGRPGTLPSLILWGPPGTGKTTLARLLAEGLGARFRNLSAVQAGVKELRQEIDEARQALEQYHQRTVLFIDEIHRFNKAQQDGLLPHVEAGTITLIGATTENPSFEINAALLSRSRVLRLEALSEADLRALIDRAIGDRERGLGREQLDVPEEVRQLLVREAGGDARRALSALEAAAAVAEADAEGTRHLDTAAVEQALQQKMLLYDKSGEEHYGVISAFIKSMRGSDADAAVYWMVRMLESGEDPLFILRRMVIFAAEDVGCADPRALQVAMAAVEAFRFIGLPEGVLPMTEACLYLSTAPKTNTALTTYAAARKAVTERGALPVPLHLRNASSKTGKDLGYGAGYKYPHNFSGNYVYQRYVPDELCGATFYEPSASGYEAEIGERLAQWRAATRRQGGEGRVPALTPETQVPTPATKIDGEGAKKG